jgi:4-hydroxybenzoate polyprenyltransferase
MRPRQWIKNGFVAAPALFAQELGSVGQVGRLVLAVACFCATSSALYLLNDVLDREEDRAHPEKRQRPIAAGLLRMRVALTAAASLGFVALVAALLLDALFALVLVGYATLTIVYTLVLKYEVILDVMSIAAGFVLRVLAGTAVLRVEPSAWILICTGLLALLLAFAKRRHEMLLLAGDRGDHRRVLAQYSPAFIDAMIVLTAGMTLTSYAIYTAIGRPATHHLAATLPFVLFGVLRYLWLVFHKGEGGSPTELVWADRPLLLAVLLWALTAALLLET